MAGFYMAMVTDQWWQAGITKNDQEAQQRQEQEKRDIEEAKSLVEMQERIKASRKDV